MAASPLQQLPRPHRQALSWAMAWTGGQGAKMEDLECLLWGWALQGGPLLPSCCCFVA